MTQSPKSDCRRGSVFKALWIWRPSWMPSGILKKMRTFKLNLPSRSCLFAIQLLMQVKPGCIYPLMLSLAFSWKLSLASNTKIVYNGSFTMMHASYISQKCFHWIQHQGKHIKRPKDHQNLSEDCRMRSIFVNPWSWRPSWTPSWILQNAQGWAQFTRQILFMWCLELQNKVR